MCGLIQEIGWSNLQNGSPSALTCIDPHWAGREQKEQSQWVSPWTASFMRQAWSVVNNSSQLLAVSWTRSSVPLMRRFIFSVVYRSSADLKNGWKSSSCLRVTFRGVQRVITAECCHRARNTHAGRGTQSITQRGPECHNWVSILCVNCEEHQ